MKLLITRVTNGCFTEEIAENEPLEAIFAATDLVCVSQIYQLTDKEMGQIFPTPNYIFNF